VTKPRVYLETTIISYLTERPSRDLIVAANQQITQDWWEMRRASFDLFVSEAIVKEASGGDESAARQRLDEIEGIPLLTLTADVAALAEKLVKELPLPERAVTDAVHVAIAATNGMDYLLTWNCKHLANAVLRSKIEDACREQGYEPPVICTPQELIEV
jgi:predicted nucleic acid-binding protein